MRASYVGPDTGKMSFSEMSRLFTKMYSNKNFMTPKILDYIDKGRYLIELSGGRGFDEKSIFGVTVINKEATEKYHDLNRMFHDYNEALLYVNLI